MNILKLIKNIFFTITILCISIFVFPSDSMAKGSVLNENQHDWLNNNVADITFSPEQDFPPMIWSQYGELFGVSNDYFDFIQQIIDVRFRVNKPRTLSEILNSIKSSGQKTIVSSVTMTPQRSEFLLFTRPYFSSPAIFISLNNKKITGSDIQDSKYILSVGNNFGVHDYLNERYPNTKFLPVDNDYQVIQALIDKKADFGAIDIASLMYLTRENNITSIYKAGDTGFSYNFSFAVNKDLPELRNILDDAIGVIPKSFRDSILEKWNIDTGELKRISEEQNSSNNNGNYYTKLIIAVGVVIIFFVFFGEYFIYKLFISRKKQKGSDNSR